MRISDWRSDVCSFDLLLIVGDVDRREAELLLQLADVLAHTPAQLGVEIGERLVEQQNRRLQHQRAGDRDALLLAAGELAGQPLANHIEPAIDAAAEVLPEGFPIRLFERIAEQLPRSEEHTSELQSLMRNSYAVF